MTGPYFNPYTIQYETEEERESHWAGGRRTCTKEKPMPKGSAGRWAHPDAEQKVIKKTAIPAGI